MAHNLAIFLDSRFLRLRFGLNLTLLLLIVFASPSVCSQSAIESQYPPAPNNPIAPIQTDSPVYKVERTRAGYAVSIPLVYTNITSGKIYVSTCRGIHPPIVEKWVQGAWITAYFQVVRACLSAPEIIDPGEEYRYTFNIEVAPRGIEYGAAI